MFNKTKLEICVDSFESAKNAQLGGADRIELCSALSEGGLTPSIGLFHQIKTKLGIPVHVLIRPRAGNFNYSKEEYEIMKNDIHTFKENKADGFVLGALSNDLEMNFEMMKYLIDPISEYSKTFHRAIDVSKNPRTIIDQSIDLGFDRILTSGSKKTAIAGFKQISEMISFAENRVSIMPGSGINETNVEKFKNLHIQDIHMSLRKKVNQTDNLGFSEQLYIADHEKIKIVKSKL